jgi:hypothetical protein
MRSLPSRESLPLGQSTTVSPAFSAAMTSATASSARRLFSALAFSSSGTLIARNSQPNGARIGFWKFVSRSIGRNWNAGHRCPSTSGGSTRPGWFGKRR